MRHIRHENARSGEVVETEPKTHRVPRKTLQQAEPDALPVLDRNVVNAVLEQAVVRLDKHEARLEELHGIVSDLARQVLDLQVQQVDPIVATLENRVRNVEQWLETEDQWHDQVVDQLKELKEWHKELTDWRGAIEVFDKATAAHLVALEQMGQLENREAQAWQKTSREMLQTHREVIEGGSKQLETVHETLSNVIIEMERRSAQGGDWAKAMRRQVGRVGRKLTQIGGDG